MFTYMQHQNRKADYSNYNFEDFLQDDFFISSIKSRDKDSMEYWKILKKQNKINWEAFSSAKDFLESLEEYKDTTLVEESLSTVWEDIQNSNRTKTKNRKLIYILSSVAASIIILLLALPYFKSIFTIEESPDISLFAQENIIESDNDNIQIVLSEDKTIKIEESDTDIVYDSTEIKIAEKEVSQKESAAYNQLIVPKGKRSKLTLSDGSRLIVNAGTRVIYPIQFSDKKREIYIDGEVFIDVSHDKNRPFIVKTSDMDIQVLGTKFNIMAYESDQNKQVVLTRGSVKILKDKKSEGIILKPSEMYENNNGYERIAKVDVSYYTSWIDGMYIFESQKLGHVALRLSRYYGIDITCSKEAENLKCSGKMDLKENIEEILKGLTFSFPIKIENNDNKYIIKKTE